MSDGASSPLKRALRAIDALQAQLDEAARARHEPLAIVGASCRLPGGADDPDRFWALLRDGVDAVVEVPPDRWQLEAVFDPDPDAPGKAYTRWGGFLRGGVDGFDPQVFGISPREAEDMDPQQRLLLEVGWEALETAGYAPDGLDGSATGVYIGVCSGDYARFTPWSGPSSHVTSYSASGVAHSVCSGRLAYVLGLRGPAISVDTACSSSLVALHLACQALRARDCDMAIAGGVHLMLAPDNTIAFCRTRMMSLAGRCRAFGAGADGFVLGEGCGVLLLKRLADAQADGDRVWAVIRGTAVNQDGASGGLTVPHGPAQEAVIRAAVADAGLQPADVVYVEAHGTGTSLGDPIELRALAGALGAGRVAGSPLLVGSVKANVGHLEAAAGVSGVLKVVMSLRHGLIPPHLHAAELNPLIPWADLPVEVTRTARPWPEGRRRIAGVSSFGFSGTNAHIVLESAPSSLTREAVEPDRTVHLLSLSARTPTALQALAGAWAIRVAGGNEPVADLAYSANVGRAQGRHRRAVIAPSREELLRSLRAIAAGDADDRVAAGALAGTDEPPVAFLFTGQGAQQSGMGRALYDTHPAFRRTLDTCAAALDGVLERPLLEVLFEPALAPLLEQTAYAQPALFALEVALAGLWRSWGIRPAAVMGHSVGELAAAWAAGVFELEEGARLAGERGRLMQALSEPGAMAAVLASEARVSEAIRVHGGDRLAIAGLNGPHNTAISGPAAEVDELCRVLAHEGVTSKRLKVSHAFHSPLMEPMLDAFGGYAATLRYREPLVPLVSNVTGERLGAGQVPDASYWVRHARQPVRFAPAVAGLLARGHRLLLEIGPRPTLTALGRQIADDGVEWLSSLRPGQDDWESLLASLSALYCQGVRVDWRGFDRGYARTLVDLPTYPFERSRFWVEGAAGPSGTVDARGLHPLLGARLDTALGPTVYHSELSRRSVPALYDHIVHGVPLLPGAAILEMATHAARDVLAASAVELRDLTIQEALILPDEGILPTQLVVTREAGGRAEVRFYSRPAGDEPGGWRLHASGVVAAASGAVPDSLSERAIDDIRVRCTTPVAIDELYAALWARGLTFGAAFQGVRRLERRDGEALGEIHLTEGAGQDAAAYALPPALLDACLQVAAAALPGFTTADHASDIFMPIGLDRFAVQAGGGLPRYSQARVQAAEGRGETLTADVDLYDEQRRPVARLEGLLLKRADSERLARDAGTSVASWLHGIAWRPLPAVTAAADGPGEAGMGRVARIATAATERAAVLSAEHGAGIYDRLVPDLDALCSAYVARALRELGWISENGEAVDIERLMSKLGVAPRHQRVFRRLLELLAEDGGIEQSEGGWRALGRTPPDADALSRRLLREYAGNDAEIEWTRRCGEQLADVLRDEVDPLQLLFPDGDLTLATRVYSETPLARTFNGVVAASVDGWLAGLPPGRPVRVLEIGAGTASTSLTVLPILPAARTEYVWTDIGHAFVHQARERLQAYPFVSCQRLDIEQSPLEQGFEAHRADVIIAANVLHATADLRRTMAHVAELLAPDGLLVMVEVTEPQRWFDLTVGLTEGWWRFADDLRSSHTLLDRAGWARLLAEAGFAETALVPGGPPPGGLGRQAVILAQGPSRPPLAGQTWLVATDEGGVGHALTRRLETDGADCVTVRQGAEYAFDRSGRGIIDPRNPEHWRRLCRDVAEGRRLEHVVYLWGLDMPSGILLTPESLPDTQAVACGGVLHLVQALVSAPLPAAPRLTIASRGAQAAGERSPVEQPGQTTLWGFGRTIALEHAELAPLLIDLDPLESNAEAEVDALIAEAVFRRDEVELARRGNAMLAARLTRGLPDAGQPARSGPVRLHPPTSGLLADLAPAPMVREAPGPGQVEIEVQAAGLNFRDLLVVLGMRSDGGLIGSECAGRVARVGAGVEALRPGDEVVAIAPRALGSFVTARSELVLPKPRNLSFEAAVTAPICFLTADFALHEVGRLKSGDRVLIHAAAGGVGLAAVQLAQKSGAVVLATAGNEEKRRYLRQLGIEHVMDSRTLAFGDEVMAITGGHGVDIVLNALTGEAIRRGLEILAPGGRFLELGKAEIWTPERARTANPHATYHAVDLTGDLEQRPQALAPTLKRLLAEVERGELRPLPWRAFPMAEAAAAFRHLERARHIGKVVLTLGIDDNNRQYLSGERFRADGVYLVTGGLSGIGLEVAGWLAERGAGALVLMGRRAPSAESRRALEAIGARGTAVHVVEADVSQVRGIERAMALVGQLDMPVRGVFHAAGVLDDGMLVQQDWARFAAVLAPKVEGGWLLHDRTASMPIEHFVLFSSIAAVLGAPGQSNHAAASAFLDGLAHHRRACGLVAASIDWGAWSGVGAAVRHGVNERAAERGLGVMTPAQGLRALARVLEDGPAQVAVLPVSWPRYARSTAGEILRPLLREVVAGASFTGVRVAAREPPRTEATGAVIERLAAAYPNQRRGILLAHVQEAAARILRLPASAPIDRLQPLSEMGLDSLMAVELRNALRQSLGRALPATLLFDYPTIEGLTDYLASAVLALELGQTGSPRPARATSARPASGDLLSLVETLSDEEVDRLLGQEVE